MNTIFREGVNSIRTTLDYVVFEMHQMETALSESDETIAKLKAEIALLNKELREVQP